ncbi:Riboflavin transporter RfnT [bacterium HR39]|nr:Riboflavin transporter RfnT [bacterium HR39]
MLQGPRSPHTGLPVIAAAALDPYRRNVLVLATAQALFFVANTTMISTSALVGLHLAPASWLATVPLGLQFLGTMASTVPASFLMQRIGRRAGLRLGAAVGTAAGLLLAFALREQSFALFAAASFLYGIFAAFSQYYRFAAADAADVVEPERRQAARARAISLVMAGGLVAGAVGPQIARLTSELFPPYLFLGSYLAVAAVGALSFMVLGLLDMPPPPAALRRGDGRPLFEIARSPGFATAVLAAVVGYVTMNLLMSATPLAMMACGHAFSATAVVIQGHVVGMFLPSFVTGSLVARIGAPRVMLAGVLLNLGTVAIDLAGVDVEHFFAALFVLGVGWNFMFIGGTTLLTQCHTPEEKAKVQGFNDFLLFSAVTLSATTSGMLHDLLGWQAMNLLTLPGLLLVGALCVGMLRRGTAESLSA